MQNRTLNTLQTGILGTNTRALVVCLAVCMITGWYTKFPAKVYTELPLKRAICLYMGTIGEAPEVSRGPIRYLLGPIRYGWRPI